MRRVEDWPLVTGAGRYVDDLQPPGLLHLALVHSPHARARMLGVDLERARGLAGVVRVITGADVAGLGELPVNRVVADLRVPAYEYLARERVHYVGTAVAAVVAGDRYTARDGAELVDIAYEPEPAVVDPELALGPEAPLVHSELGTNECFRLAKAGGDVDAALAAADHVVRLKLYQPRVLPFAMETRAVLASYDRALGELTVWSSTQVPHTLAETLAEVLDFPAHRLRVIAPDVGGGFGAKVMTYREEVLVAWAAVQLGRPVKWIATRSEDLLTTLHGRGLITEVTASARGDGVVTGLRARILIDQGAELMLHSAMPAYRAVTLTPGPYRIPNVEAGAIGVFTNTAPTGPYRGSGRPEAAFAVERVMDEVARLTGIDPAEVRRRNFIGAAELPYRSATGLQYDSGDYAQTLDVALKRSGYAELRARQAEERARGTLYGIGVASFVEPSGGGGWESGTVRAEAGGTFVALTGASAHGQGHRTTFAQVLADRLGVPFEAISVRHGDTAQTPPGVGTFGSRSVALGGGALVQAADRVIEKARRLASHLLEAATADVEFREGRFSVAGIPDRSVGWAEVAAAAYPRAYGSVGLAPGEEPGLEATAFFRPEGETYGYGSYVAAVRVDRESGRLAIERLVLVDDSGVIVNPLLVDGQLWGGLAQGLGIAVSEEVVYDEQGQLLTGTLLDYAIPIAEWIPSADFARTVTPTPLNPLGAKGVGEAATIGLPPVIVAAVLDALAPLGVTHADIPLTPQKVWAIIRERETVRTSA